MKDVTGREIQVGDKIAFARRTGKYSKRHVIVKGTVMGVKEHRITYTFEARGYNYNTQMYELQIRTSWTKSPQKILII